MGRKVKLYASLSHIDRTTYNLKDLGLDETATEEEIEKALYEIVVEGLDWGFEEIE